jgi:hypothetical protein
MANAWNELGNGERNAAKNSIMGLIWERLDDLQKAQP